MGPKYSYYSFQQVALGNIKNSSETSLSMLFSKKTYNFGVRWMGGRLHLTLFGPCRNKRIF